jgi:hypothetical protein
MATGYGTERPRVNFTLGLGHSFSHHPIQTYFEAQTAFSLVSTSISLSVGEAAFLIGFLSNKEEMAHRSKNLLFLYGMIK